jgi:hypothetical protein
MKQIHPFTPLDLTPRSLDFTLAQTRANESKEELGSADSEWANDLRITEPLQLLEGNEADLELHRQFSCPNFIKTDKRSTAVAPSLNNQLLGFNRGQSLAQDKSHGDQSHQEDFVTPKMSSIGRILEEIRNSTNSAESPKTLTDQVQRRIEKLMNAPNRGEKLSDISDY